MEIPAAANRSRKSLQEVLQTGITNFSFPAAAGVAQVGQLPYAVINEPLSCKYESEFAALTQAKFWWASVTKPVFAYSVLRACEQGILDLQASVSQILGRPLRYRGQDCPQITLAHLMAHTAGLGHDHDLYVNDAEGLQKLLASTGPIELAYKYERKRLYANFGFDLLGYCLQKCSGYTPGQWVDEQVLKPLGMFATKLDYSPAASVAKDFSGPLVDLLKFAAELLQPTLVSEGLLIEATAVAWPGIAGIVPAYGRHNPNDWAIGFEVRGNKEPHWTAPSASPQTFGHFGMGGSFLWVDRQLGAAGVFLSGQNFSPEHKEKWPIFNELVYQELRCQK